MSSVIINVMFALLSEFRRSNRYDVSIIEIQHVHRNVGILSLKLTDGGQLYGRLNTVHIQQMHIRFIRRRSIFMLIRTDWKKIHSSQDRILKTVVVRTFAQEISVLE